MQCLNPVGKPWPRVVQIAAATVAIAAWSCLPGCERKERVLDIKAPGVDVEVDKIEKSSGESGVDIKVKKPADEAKSKAER